MSIYTSYFAKINRNMLNIDHVKVNIAVSRITGVEMEELDNAKPRVYARKFDLPIYLALKRGYIDKDEYTQTYIEYIEANRMNILEELKQISAKHKDKPIILYCYEKSGDFCHSHLLADKLKEWGLDVKGEF